ncbi:SDR family oxidoreductase [Yoonia sp.]|uniref:SDR family oxidoreductase n=1 Tax=Yoonia sp. TaxID=2212373 RepID=UPI002E04EB82|nr:SDR family oxidoreductase [Yoonia sp.]
MGLVTDKVALVTGGAAGIGRATAKTFAAEGAKVVVSDVNQEGGAETVRMIEKAGGTALFVAADVSKKADVSDLIAKTVAAYGRLDCAVNNAGIEGKIAPFAAQSEENFDAIIGVNLKGTFLCLQAEIAAMLETGGGTIVNLSSIAGLIGFSGLSPYVASKHGVIGLTKNVALEYATSGIRVNAVCPGGVDTRMLDSLAEQATSGAQSSTDMMAPLHPMGRIGTPQEIADLIVWLSSPRAGFITGTAIPIDGGYVAQ